jgi:hypothetical protein
MQDFPCHGSRYEIVDESIVIRAPHNHGRKLAKYRSAAAALLPLLVTTLAAGQDAGPENSTTDRLQGTVINRITREPIPRALVSSFDERFAAMTDGGGHFDFGFPSASSFDEEVASHPSPGAAAPPGPRELQAQKPGFLQDDYSRISNLGPSDKEVTIALTPEALIVGRVVLPSSEPTNKIQLELYRRDVREGRGHWVTAASALSRSNGEFRFSGLSAGSYKLLTREWMDRDSLPPDPRTQLYGYPPVYFANARSFAAAETIQLSPGMTVAAEIPLVKRAYYQVSIPVMNAPPGAPVLLRVDAQSEGPGYSLGFDRQQQTITGTLPDGNYTIKASAYGPPGMYGAVHIAVNGAAVDGPRMVMVANASINVNVSEQFTANGDSESPQSPAGESQPRVEDRSGALRGQIPHARPYDYLNFWLEPADDFGTQQQVRGSDPKSSQDRSFVFENVQPGRYWAQSDSSRGYVSSITCGGVDLLLEPLVLPEGGSVPAIELTVKDDGADVSGTVEGLAKPSSAQGEATLHLDLGNSDPRVYLVPLPDSDGTFRETSVSRDGTFNLQQVPPGSYRVFAFDRPQPPMEWHNAEAMRAFQSNGQTLRIVAGQKLKLQLPLISTNP